MKKIKNCLPFVAVLVLVLCACNGAETPQKSKSEVRLEAKAKAAMAVNDFYTLPSPLETAFIISATGVEYNLDILHRTELGMRYSTNRAAAVNLGIYGADLSYSIYFNKQQIALKYLDCIKNLSSGLDIADMLSQNRLKEMEDNIQNSEALKKIVSKTFFHSDALLKETSRRPTAVMIAAGMWIESLYISTQLSQCNAGYNPALSKAVVEQGLILEDLFNMLSVQGGNADLDFVKSELQPLRTSFSAIREKNGNSFIIKDGAPDTELYGRLCECVTDVRRSMTQLF